MQTLKSFILLSVVIMCLCSCVNGSRNARNQVSASEAGNVSGIHAQFTKTFLDFTFDGSKEDFIKQSARSKIFVIEDSAKVVDFLGAKWGLNFDTDSCGLTGIVLITSNKSRLVYQNARKVLLPILGQPYDDDLGEERMHWYMDESSDRAVFRHLHTDDGGWTFYYKYKLR